MDHNKLHDLLHDFVDGELDPELEERVRRELEEHPDLKGEADAIRCLKRLLVIKVQREPMPPGLERRVREAVTMDVGPRRWGPSRRTIMAAAAIVLVAVSAVFFTGPWLSEQIVLHADMVNDAYTAALKPLPELETGPEYAQIMRDEFGLRIDPEVVEANGYEFVGWSRQELCDGKVDSIRLDYEKDGAQMTCFTWSGELTADERDKLLGSKMVKIPGATICECHREDDGEDGFTVFCFRVDSSSTDVDADRVIIVLNSLLEDGFDRDDYNLRDLISSVD